MLVAVLVLARTVYKDGDGPLNWFEAFYRIGSIIYGGGQVRCMTRHAHCHSYVFI